MKVTAILCPLGPDRRWWFVKKQSNNQNQVYTKKTQQETWSTQLLIACTEKMKISLLGDQLPAFSYVMMETDGIMANIGEQGEETSNCM